VDEWIVEVSMSWLGYYAAKGLSDLAESELAPSKARGEDYLLPDEQARQRAVARLAEDAQVQAGNVEVRVLSGKLVLSGSVPDDATKTRVEQLCTGIAGVTSVENALRVG
jgi:osmotically-inducible protein OsmY